MRRDQLAEIGGFVAETPIEREVAWTRADGERFTFAVFIRQLPFSEFEEFAAGDASDLGKLFSFLAKTIWLEGDDGLTPLGIEDAKRLNQGLALALWEAAREVNGLGEGKP